jgi:hypothetical protein
MIRTCFGGQICFVGESGDCACAAPGKHNTTAAANHASIQLPFRRIEIIP